MVGGNSKVVQDVPPYILVDGHPAKAFSLNSVGLLRANIPIESKSKLKKAFRFLYRSGMSISKALEKIREEIEEDVYVENLVNFIQESKRGICKGLEIKRNKKEEFD
jgi:UDP-N-acetylglucosamine acyltransferase